MTRDEADELARAAARRVHARFGVTAPRDLYAMDALAAALGAYVIERDIASGDARSVRADGRALILLPHGWETDPRARYSLGHELAHHVMHPDHDALERLHGAPKKSGTEHRIERDADVFSSELNLPRALLAPRCCEKMPTLDHVGEVARLFRMSLSATATAWTSVAPAACAFVQSKGGFVRRMDASAAFRGKVYRDRALEAGTAAAALAHGEGAERAAFASPRGAWGTEKADVEVWEQSVRVPRTRVVLTWLWHA